MDLVSLGQDGTPVPDASGDGRDERPAEVWGPTFGPETELDAARPRPGDAPKRRGWHPPGGPW